MVEKVKINNNKNQKDMETINETTQEKAKLGLATKGWSTLCHNCSICKFSHKKPGSNFDKVMEWHRTWCPGWASHTKVYGLKDLS